MKTEVDPRFYNSRTMIVEWNGEKRSLAGWSNKLGIPRDAMRGRYHRGLRPPELFKPVMKRGLQGMKVNYNVDEIMLLKRNDPVRKMIRMYAQGFSLREICDKLEMKEENVSRALRCQGLYIDRTCYIESQQDAVDLYHGKQATHRLFVRMSRFHKLPPDVQERTDGEVAALMYAKRLESAAFSGVRSLGSAIPVSEVA